MSSSTRQNSLPHIVEFDGLRGCLAWWVVLYHASLTTGVEGLNIKPIHLTIGQGFLAVPLFFTLSGFVIAYLEESRAEHYGVFLLRRFFRLAPVYYLALIVGIVEAALMGSYGSRLWAHILMHLTILQGLVPDRLLPGCVYSLEQVSWSISVEWQFYLIAPMVLFAVRKSATWAIGCLAIFGVGAYLYGHVAALGPDITANVFQQAGAFGLGIGSFYLLRFAIIHKEITNNLTPCLLPVGLTLAWTCGGPLISAGTIWGILYSAVLSYHCGAEPFFTRPIRRILQIPTAVWLGRLSYCTYLCHLRLIVLISDSMAPRLGVESPWARFALVVVLGFPAIILISKILHRLVEKPGIRLGKYLASRFDPTPTLAAVPEHLSA